MTQITQIQKEASKYGLTVTHCDGMGHYQIDGKGIVVNYWPDSNHRTAYVQGTTRSHRNVSIEQACQMALQPPPVVIDYSRKGNYRREKHRMLQRSPQCHWCQTPLSMDGEVPGTVSATLDHVIPLSRGGLDHHSNHVLACEPCNTKRANTMPEIQPVLEWEKFLYGPAETAAEAYARGFEDCRNAALQIVDEHEGYLQRVESLEPPAYGDTK